MATGDFASASMSAYSTPKIVTKQSVSQSGSESDSSAKAGDGSSYDSNDDDEEPSKSKARPNEDRGCGSGIAYIKSKQLVLSNPRVKTLKPLDRALLTLEEIRTTHQTQVSKLSFLQQANDVLNAEFLHIFITIHIYINIYIYIYIYI
jgi:hypothetical protein